MVGVDVLAEQRDLAGASDDHAAGFGDDLCRRARELGAARIGHDAEGAELVAAFLDRQERRDAGGGALARQEVELALDREVGVQHPLAGGAAGSGDHLGELVVGLRAEHHVHEGRAGHDLLALGLRDAAGDGDDHAAAVFLGGLTVLLDAQAAEFGKDLLRRLLADVAGVQDDHIGPVGGLDRLIAQGSQDIGHTGAVIDVHLAAPGLDEQFLLGQMLNPDARVDPRYALSVAMHIGAPGELCPCGGGKIAFSGVGESTGCCSADDSIRWYGILHDCWHSQSRRNLD